MPKHVLPLSLEFPEDYLPNSASISLAENRLFGCSLICNFYLSVASLKIELISTWDLLACCWDIKQAANNKHLSGWNVNQFHSQLPFPSGDNAVMILAVDSHVCQHVCPALVLFGAVEILFTWRKKQKWKQPMWASKRNEKEGKKDALAAWKRTCPVVVEKKRFPWK